MQLCWQCCCGCPGECKRKSQDTASCLTGTNRDYIPYHEAEYHHVLRFKGLRAVYYKPTNSKYTVGQLKYRQDLGAAKALWHDDFTDDIKQNAKNNHLYMSPFTASRMHPFNRKERLVVLAASVIMSLSLAFFKAGVISSKKDQADDSDTDDYTDSEQNTDEIVLSIVSSLLLFICTFVLTYLGTCNCAQGESRACCRSLFEKMAHWIMFFWFIGWTMFWASAGIGLAAKGGINWGACIRDTFLNVIYTALLTDPLFMLLFYWYGRYSEHKEVRNQQWRVGQGMKPQYTHNVPYSYYVEWKEAGFPKFDADPSDLSDEEKDNAENAIIGTLKKASEKLASVRQAGGATAMLGAVVTMAKGAVSPKTGAAEDGAGDQVPLTEDKVTAVVTANASVEPEYGGSDAVTATVPVTASAPVHYYAPATDQPAGGQQQVAVMAGASAEYVGYVAPGAPPTGAGTVPPTTVVVATAARSEVPVPEPETEPEPTQSVFQSRLMQGQATAKAQFSGFMSRAKGAMKKDDTGGDSTAAT